LEGSRCVYLTELKKEQGTPHRRRVEEGKFSPKEKKGMTQSKGRKGIRERRGVPMRKPGTLPCSESGTQKTTEGNDILFQGAGGGTLLISTRELSGGERGGRKKPWALNEKNLKGGTSLKR